MSYNLILHDLTSSYGLDWSYVWGWVIQFYRYQTQPAVPIVSGCHLFFFLLQFGLTASDCGPGLILEYCKADFSKESCFVHWIGFNGTKSHSMVQRTFCTKFSKIKSVILFYIKNYTFECELFFTCSFFAIKSYFLILL